MQALLDVVLPVFLIIGLGYGAARTNKITEDAVDGVMMFAQNFAVPMLLFRAISNIDIAQDLALPLLGSYYIGALSGFGLAYVGARQLFGRSTQDSIAIGFCGMYSNSVLLGLPITERAYGADALRANYAIIALHAPVMYTFGTILMEFAKSKGRGLGIGLARQILLSIFRNPFVIGILLGLAVNLSGAVLPRTILLTVDMMASAALPAALFGLGGVLVRYRPEGDAKTIAMLCGISLVAHPAVTYALAQWVFVVDQAQLRSAVITASMAPGVNAYLFANLYGSARRVVAATVLITTALSVITTWIWLAILP